MVFKKAKWPVEKTDFFSMHRPNVNIKTLSNDRYSRERVKSHITNFVRLKVLIMHCETYINL